MSKIVHLLVAGALATGGAGAVTAVTAFAAPTTPALACTVDKPGAAEIHYADSLPTLRYGSHGTAVLGLQMYLRQEGITYLSGTGNFGAHTRQAVRHFQAKHNLPVTGVVDKTVWRKVISNKFHLPVDNYPNPQVSPGQTLHGNSGFALKNLTMRLSGLPWFAWNDDHKAYHGPLLESVREFQHRVGLNPSGVFGARTTASMNTVIAIAGDWGC